MAGSKDVFISFFHCIMWLPAQGYELLICVSLTKTASPPNPSLCDLSIWLCPVSGQGPKEVRERGKVHYVTFLVPSIHSSLSNNFLNFFWCCRKDYSLPFRQFAKNAIQDDFSSTHKRPAPPSLTCTQLPMMLLTDSKGSWFLSRCCLTIFLSIPQLTWSFLSSLLSG